MRDFSYDCFTLLLHSTVSTIAHYPIRFQRFCSDAGRGSYYAPLSYLPTFSQPTYNGREAVWRRRSPREALALFLSKICRWADRLLCFIESFAEILLPWR